MIDDIEGVGSDSFPVTDEQPALEVETDELPAVEEAETEEETEAQVEEKPKGKSVQERIDEITADKYAERRRAEAAEARLAALEAAAKPEATAEASTDRPDPTQFEFGEADPAYIEALTDWKVETKLADAEQRRAASDTAKQLDQAYAQHVAAVKEELPDYDEKVTKAAARGEWPCPQSVAELIKSTPLGPKVAYHLATNPDDAIAVAGMSPTQQAAAFGMIAAHIANQPAKQPNIATNAPEPAPARTKGGQFASPSGLDDRLSGEEWLRRRNAQVYKSA